MNILIDTNVLLDFLLQRESFFVDAKEVFIVCAKNNYSVHITASTVTDIYYITSKYKSKAEAAVFIESIIETFFIDSVGKAEIKRAVDLNFTDFEDALQVSIAEANDINLIITRNKRDFLNSSIKVLEPKEFISKEADDTIAESV
ncbi:MAG: PIN domain-containing protein [Bacteroidales bacterium]|nr:PIN domain-containing protein [Bacteroidales bacterium]